MALESLSIWTKGIARVTLRNLPCSFSFALHQESFLARGEAIAVNVGVGTAFAAQEGTWFWWRFAWVLKIGILVNFFLRSILLLRGSLPVNFHRERASR